MFVSPRVCSVLFLLLWFYSDDSFVVVCDAMEDQSSEQDSLSLGDQVVLLRKQVTALLEKRGEDFQMMEESVKRALDRSKEMVDVKKQIDDLRTDISGLQGIAPVKQQPSHPNLIQPLIKDTQHSNDRLRLEWASTAVSELRRSVDELESATRHRRRHVDSELAALRRELAGARSEQLQNEATLAQLVEMVTAVRDSRHVDVASCTELKEQLKSAEREWSYKWNTLMSSTTSDERKLLVSDGGNQEDDSSRKSRHQRLLKKRIVELERTNRELFASQKLLNEKIHSMEDVLNGVQDTNQHFKPAKRGYVDRNVDNRLRLIENRMDKVEKSVNSGADNDYQSDQSVIRNEVISPTEVNLSNRVESLEKAQKVADLSMFNMSRQVNNFDKLHRSILELLEKVESIENKVDKTVPDFRKEISKLEFDMAQTMSEVALMKEDQSNAIRSVKAIGAGVSNLKDKVDMDHETLEQVNITLTLLQESDSLQNRKIHDHILKAESSQLPESFANANSTTNIVQELEEVENEYHSIINKLPHDCGSVSGPSGLYLISPGAGEPVMASCNSGWTIIQRRRDGTVDFNRNWDEYSRGFGSASGEFWIGNRVLNRLTKENCSMLRIEMVDIYGKSYHAEYSEFIVEGLSNGYRLTVSGYDGNSSDALDYQNKMEFSTIDSDRDISNTHCASNYEGGWWFSHCQHANLNGRYNLGLTWFDSARNEWIAVATSEMKVKRREDCQIH